ncbi:hypothetical protein Hsero_2079 [Herbaspirillum seropedicae SmR1]|uniref:Uncharacterized protein n=1 Tax=Herbaspirillum seropedicae (strain SmR1) TaxID=757424 RepID=D8IT20_HERSS|nr:hypothetical protein Hsero_2079 [Herbaspirillum seropedicae SmR1]
MSPPVSCKTEGSRGPPCSTGRAGIPAFKGPYRRPVRDGARDGR